jgi:hypothetical protein
MNTLETLQSNVAKWADAIDERKARIEVLNSGILSLVSDSIDGTDAKQKAARNKRAEYLAELESMTAELSELAWRLEVAIQSVNEYKLNVAQEVYDRADKDAHDKRAVLLKMQDAKLRFINKGGRKGLSDSSVVAKKKIEVDLATAQADLTIANRRKDAAGKVVKALREGRE